ncbi:hypothetical protein B9Z19DRAFT_1047514 [Tuber borchii]|uniref:Uncharacterized protein n=1 Tax=Tuber borchii TaxID=42251 RepID=A0A2T6ZU51_TUBBO|nr:hypothetical protein B9Z19DRAFT_1047514 [Tuber borchii]
MSPPLDRSPWRDTYIYASDNRSSVLGGLWVAEGVTNANLYSMLEIFCLFTDTFDLRDSSERLVERDGQRLKPGNYYIFTAGSITITKEVALTRTPSLPSGTRVTPFTDAVRQRDRRCIITGRPARLAHLNSWDTFEATHIFPLAYEEYWNDFGYHRWITVPPANESDGTINSVQNGILLGSDMQCLFDSYRLAINPNDNYKIVCFAPNTLDYSIAGRHLDQTFLDNPHRPVDQVLRWHFRQAVLVNMKGAGEACFETDFPPGSDMIGEIMSGAKAAERMEFELFTRFNAMEDRA